MDWGLTWIRHVRPRTPVGCLAAVLVVFSEACSRAGAGVATPARVSNVVAVDSQIYTVQRRSGALVLEIETDVVNSSDLPLYIGTCGDNNPRFQIEARSGDEWTTAYRPTCLLEQSPPIKVPRRSAKRLRIVASDSPASPRDSLSSIWKGGTYRVVLAIFSGYDNVSRRETGLLETESRASSAFVIRPEHP